MKALRGCMVMIAVGFVGASGCKTGMTLHDGSSDASTGDGSVQRQTDAGDVGGFAGASGIGGATGSGGATGAGGTVTSTGGATGADPTTFTISPTSATSSSSAAGR